MKMLIMPNLEKAKAKDVTQKLITILDKAGIACCMDERYQDDFEGCFFGTFSAVSSQCDAIAAVGGDGTIIHSAGHAARLGVPILGVNTGRLGFIAALESDELERAAELCDSKKYHILDCMVLDVKIQGKNEQSLIAVNDAVISSGSLAKVVEVTLFDGEKKIADYRSDGIIFSTPMGSTAYNLSAGGPIVENGVECILVTPICPHSLLSRSLAASSEKRLSAEAHSTSQGDVVLTVDGESLVKLEPGDRVTVQKSQKKVQLIRFGEKSVYEVLQNKLGMMNGGSYR